MLMPGCLYAYARDEAAHADADAFSHDAILHMFYSAYFMIAAAIFRRCRHYFSMLRHAMRHAIITARYLC